jgi:hypothetical protein
MTDPKSCVTTSNSPATNDPAWRRLVLSFESGTASLSDLLAARPASTKDEPRTTDVWIPSDERTKAKEALRERWDAPELRPLRDRASAAYHEFLRATGEDVTT